MNAGAFITALATGLTAVATVLVTWFVKRTDRVAKLTQANMHDQEYVLKLVGALRDDYWAIVDWAYSARSRFLVLLTHANPQNAEQFTLDPIPAPKHRDLEADRINLSSDEGK